MKYELLVTLKQYAAGFVFNELQYDTLKVPLELALKHGLIKEVPEPKRPKFRVGDYAMHVNGKVAVKIHSVLLPTDDDNEYKYAYADNRWKYESVLRTPTKEELELYFR